MLAYLAFSNLFRNVRRTVTVLTTIALGSGALLCFKGFNQGMLKQYRDTTIHSHYGFGQLNTKGYHGKVFDKPWEHWIKNWPAVKEYLEKDPHVTHIFPRISFSALLSKDKISVSGQGQGIEAKEESAFFHSLDVIEGKALLEQPKGMLIGKGLAEALRVKVGDTVKLMARTSTGKYGSSEFQVTGIFHTGSQSFDNHHFRVHLADVQAFLKTQSIENVSLGLKDIEDWDLVETMVEKAFPELDAVAFAELDKVYYQHSVDWLNAQFQVIQVIILMIVLLGIFNTTATSILERKQEIGNFRANGESTWDVMELLLWEGGFLGIIGALIGITVSLAVVKTVVAGGVQMPPGPGLTKPVFVTFAFDSYMLLSTLFLTLIAALVATAVSAFRVLNMSIAESLRSA